MARVWVGVYSAAAAAAEAGVASLSLHDPSAPGGKKREGKGGGLLGSAATYVMREKEYRRLAFELAGKRFEELSPVLARLNELEAEQVGDVGGCLAVWGV